MSGVTFEAKQLGWAAVVAAPFSVAALVFFGVLAQLLGAGAQTDRVLSAIVQVASLVGGVSAVSAAAIDPAIELRLSLPLGVRRSVAIRLALALAWCGFVIAVATLALHALGRLTFEVADSPAADQLVWLPPLVFLAGVGALATAAFRSASAGAGIVAVSWILSNLLSQVWRSVPWLQPLWIAMPYEEAAAAAWYWNRLSVTLVGALCIGLAAILLGRSERLLGVEG